MGWWTCKACVCVRVRTKMIWSPTWDYCTWYSSCAPMLETRAGLQPVTMVPTFCGWPFSRGVCERVKDLTGTSTMQYGPLLLCACLCTKEHVTWFQKIDTFNFFRLWVFIKWSVPWCNIIHRLLHNTAHISLGYQPFKVGLSGSVTE
jgi:hypothetical protein